MARNQTPAANATGGEAQATLREIAQTMQVMADNMGRQTELMNRQVQQAPQGIERRGAEAVLFSEFRKVGAPVFEGSVDPQDADHWISGIERAFVISGCAEGQKTLFATHMLDKEALLWWNNMKRVVGAADTVIPWREFKRVFHDKYVPAAVRQAKEVEFLTLQQGSMSVPEYTARFESLIRYSLYYQEHPNETWKCNRYKEGLKLSIQRLVNHVEFQDFTRLTETCRVIEVTDQKGGQPTQLEGTKKALAP